jgi:hypothetical protein
MPTPTPRRPRVLACKGPGLNYWIMRILVARSPARGSSSSLSLVLGDKMRRSSIDNCLSLYTIAPRLYSIDGLVLGLLLFYQGNSASSHRSDLSELPLGSWLRSTLVSMQLASRECMRRAAAPDPVPVWEVNSTCTRLGGTTDDSEQSSNLSAGRLSQPQKDLLTTAPRMNAPHAPG